MADTIEAQCGYCQKRFRLTPEQVNREVLCPHCKTTVRIEQPIAPVAPPAQAPVPPRRKTPSGPAKRTRRPATHASRRAKTLHKPRAKGRSKDTRSDHEDEHERPVLSHAGFQNRNVAIVMAVIIGLALVGVIVGLVVVLHGYEPAEKKPPHRPAQANATTPSTPTTPTTPATAGASTPTDPTTVPGTEPTGAENAGATGTKTRGPDVVTQAITADISRLLRGYSGETVTYAVGHVTNNSNQMIYAIRIVVELWESEDGKKVGDATAIILNLPPKHTAPIVAKCTHEPELRAKYWMLGTYETNPVGVPQDLPPLEAIHPVPLGDPNSLDTEGIIRTVVANHGRVPVSDLFISAILMNEKGKIVGVAQSRATEKIEPGDEKDVEIMWLHTAGTLVRYVEAWAQPYYYQEK